MIARKPLKPKELVVKWTEFVAEFQDLSNLDIAGRDFGFVKYFMLDVFVPALFLLAAVLYVAVKLGYFTFRKCSLTYAVKAKQL